MKTKQILLIISIIGMFMLGSCGSKSHKEVKQASSELPAGVHYTCTMHPEVKSDKPGNCPKCGMDLVRSDEVEKSGTDTTMHEHEGHQH